MRAPSRTLLGLLLAGSFLGATTGCQSWMQDNKKGIAWPLSRFAHDYENPQRIAGIWSPDILTMPGATATRGFGGRLYFYNDKSIPVPVKGELTVYGFEEPGETISAATLKKTEPDKKFKFESAKFTEHFSKSDLGASYSIWIPWDAAGGVTKRITLLPVFKTEDGKIIHGDAAELTLPGKTPQPNPSYQVANPMLGPVQALMAQPGRTAVPGVQPASYSQNQGYSGMTQYANGAPVQPMGYAPSMPQSPTNATGFGQGYSQQGAAPAPTQHFVPNQGSNFGANYPGNNAARNGMETTTIQLPSRTATLLSHPGSQPPTIVQQAQFNPQMWAQAQQALAMQQGAVNGNGPNAPSNVAPAQYLAPSNSANGMIPAGYPQGFAPATNNPFPNSDGNIGPASFAPANMGASSNGAMMLMPGNGQPMQGMQQPAAQPNGSSAGGFQQVGASSPQGSRRHGNVAAIGRNAAAPNNAPATYFFKAGETNDTQGTLISGNGPGANYAPQQQPATR